MYDLPAVLSSSNFDTSNPKNWQYYKKLVYVTTTILRQLRRIIPAWWLSKWRETACCSTNSSRTRVRGATCSRGHVVEHYCNFTGFSVQFFFRYWVFICMVDLSFEMVKQEQHKTSQSKNWQKERTIARKYFKGAVSRYSVIFLRFFARGKMATAHASVADIRPWQLGQPREQLHPQAESRKSRFPRAIVVFHGLALWPPLFFPTQNGCQKTLIIMTLPL